MYPDEEKRTRERNKSDSSGDKLADAVTHPSKPYVEMSFGMGKDGFPAISMTQHARQQILPVAKRENRRVLSPAHRSRMGIRLLAPAPPPRISGAMTPANWRTTPGSNRTAI